MIIAKSGDYELCLPTYLCDHEYMTHDLEICKREPERNTKFIIANFNEDGEIVSCGGRLLDIMDSIEDIGAVRELAKIAEDIFCTDNVPNEYGKMITIKVTSYDADGKEKKTSVYKKPTDQDISVWASTKYSDCETHYFYSADSALRHLVGNNEDYIIHECDGYYTIEINDDEIGEYSKLDIKF